MRQKLQTKKEQGFTIIEVLIVLAIAGLILLIVFLAVPALERNAHNTQRKHDVASILGAMNEFVNNNAGSLPSTDCSGNCVTKGSKWLANAKIGYYTEKSVIYKQKASSAPTADSMRGDNHEKVYVLGGFKCNTSPTQVPITADNSRSFVAWYAVQTGSGYQAQCELE
jgi:prepilin-type N-terminal cleavage/methylation domain-containing protein